MLRFVQVDQVVSLIFTIWLLAFRQQIFKHKNIFSAFFKATNDGKGLDPIQWISDFHMKFFTFDSIIKWFMNGTPTDFCVFLLRLIILVLTRLFTDYHDLFQFETKFKTTFSVQIHFLRFSFIFAIFCFSDSFLRIIFCLSES